MHFVYLVREANVVCRRFSVLGTISTTLSSQSAWSKQNESNGEKLAEMLTKSYSSRKTFRYTYSDM